MSYRFVQVSWMDDRTTTWLDVSRGALNNLAVVKLNPCFCKKHFTSLYKLHFCFAVFPKLALGGLCVHHVDLW